MIIFCCLLLNNALLLPIIQLFKKIFKDFVKFRIMIISHSLQIYNFLYLSAYNLQVNLTKRKPTNLQISHFESCRFYNGKSSFCDSFLLDIINAIKDQYICWFNFNVPRFSIKHFQVLITCSDQEEVIGFFLALRADLASLFLVTIQR